MTKAITLWQPWATLVAIGAKEYETRSWATSHRGVLAIHAAKTNQHIQVARNSEPMRQALLDAGFSSTLQLPLGKVVALVQLVDCFPVEHIWHSLEEPESSFGDFSAGRFAWELRLIQRYDPPIVARGRQGLWNWTQSDT
jgi:hypothetical protein